MTRAWVLLPSGPPKRTVRPYTRFHTCATRDSATVDRSVGATATGGPGTEDHPHEHGRDRAGAHRRQDRRPGRRDGRRDARPQSHRPAEVADLPFALVGDL